MKPSYTETWNLLSGHGRTISQDPLGKFVLKTVGYENIACLLLMRVVTTTPDGGDSPLPDGSPTTADDGDPARWRDESDGYGPEDPIACEVLPTRP